MLRKIVGDSEPTPANDEEIKVNSKESESESEKLQNSKESESESENSQNLIEDLISKIFGVKIVVIGGNNEENVAPLQVLIAAAKKIHDEIQALELLQALLAIEQKKLEQDLQRAKAEQSVIGKDMVRHYGKMMMFSCQIGVSAQIVDVNKAPQENVTNDQMPEFNSSPRNFG